MAACVRSAGRHIYNLAHCVITPRLDELRHSADACQATRRCRGRAAGRIGDTQHPASGGGSESSCCLGKEGFGFDASWWREEACPRRCPESDWRHVPRPHSPSIRPTFFTDSTRGCQPNTVFTTSTLHPTSPARRQPSYSFQRLSGQRCHGCRCSRSKHLRGSRGSGYDCRSESKREGGGVGRRD